MTQIFETGLQAIITEDGQTYRIVHVPSLIKFKNESDAQQWFEILHKLQGKKGIFPKYINGNDLIPFKTETAFFTQNELNLQEEKKKWIKSKLDDDELIDLGLTP